ncbi:MAG: xanthine dehydrogenase family protein molybdopterin-binding subunit [Deltaproteobacteria bacterium]|nr:xanthine dehydrogenase family protein molybdopterin-binding subunit [Deltaproteobacteria bacterium]
MNEAYKQIGKAVPKVDIQDLLRGKACYAEDVSFPDMLHLKVLRSDRPHARIVKIDTAKAEVQPGVVAVYTAKDIPGRNLVGFPVCDQPVLCADKVRFIGDPLALVAAETLEAAEAALALIRVEYEDLPALCSPEEALAPGAVQIHENGNVLLDRPLIKGDFEAALKKADVVIHNTYRSPMVQHACLQVGAGVATYDGDQMTIWTPSKEITVDHEDIAASLGLPMEKVRIIGGPIGGAFGDKRGLAHGYYAALASFKTGRPAKMVFTREEYVRVATKRHPFVVDYTTAATKDGKIIGVKADVVGDGGAYASWSPTVMAKAMVHAAGPYEVPNIQVRVRVVYTNNPIAGAMRGLGVPQMALAYESQVDILAETLQLDPFEIRLKNAFKPGSVTHTGQRLGNSVGLVETIEQVRDEVAKRPVPPPAGAKRYAWGVACMYYGIGAVASARPSVSRLEASDAGAFTLYVNTVDVGQGSSTLFAQIVAEVLGCRLEQVQLRTADSSFPDTGSAGSSKLTYVAGRCVEIAAQNMKAMLQGTAAKALGVRADEVLLAQEVFYHPGAPERRVSLAEAVKRLRGTGAAPVTMGRFLPPVEPLDKKTGQGVPMGTYAFATQAALVCVDVESGEVEVLDVVASHDVGKVINLHGVTGQIEGAVAMGMGGTLMEEIVLKNGAIQNLNFSNYFIPTAMDVPEVTCLIVEKPEPTGPFGAKGVGEPANVATTPAILNAVRAATGVRVKELPLTSEKLWMLLNR